jgi:hypothetical protein
MRLRRSSQRVMCAGLGGEPQRLGTVRECGGVKNISSWPVVVSATPGGSTARARVCFCSTVFGAGGLFG